jgi:hypothetical protein
VGYDDQDGGPAEAGDELADEREEAAMTARPVSKPGP